MLRNRAIRSRIKTILKKARASSDPDAAATVYRQASSLLDRAVSKGVLHPNTAARHKARLAAHARAVGAVL